jgi:hypothetical protein
MRNFLLSLCAHGELSPQNQARDMLSCGLPETSNALAHMLTLFHGTSPVRVFGQQLLLHYKHETRAVAPAERKAPSLNFSRLLRERLPTPPF